MDSIFPGLGPNPFDTKPMVDYFHPGKKPSGGGSQQSAGAYPAPTQTSAPRPVGSPAPGRGQRVDFMA